MISAISAGKIFSTLGNDKSLVPMAIKDIANSCGLTAGSYVSGDKLEGKDRFIDEFGTQAIWLFGIPTYKKIIDLTLYKALKVDPNFDVRNLKAHRANILNKSIEYADNSIKQSIKYASDNIKFTKNLAMGKFLASTVLTIASYWGLTKYRHQYTKNSAKKEILKEIEKNNSNVNYNNFTSDRPDWFNKSQKPTFTGSIQDFMYNPVKNLMILDGAITTERLAHSRNKQDLIGYTIKEGSFWAFMYFASKPIQKFLENVVEKNKKSPASIKLDARVIESKELQQALSDGTLKSSVAKILELNSSEDLMDFVHNNPNDFTVKMAKKSDVLPTLKNSKQADNIDYRKFIDFDDFKNVAKNLNKLDEKYSEFKLSEVKSKSLDSFLKNVKKLKRGATLLNIGSCIGFLGILAPLIMVIIRKFDSKGFQVKEDLKKEIMQNNK